MHRRNMLSISAITALGLAFMPGSAVSQQKFAQGSTRRSVDARFDQVQVPGWENGRYVWSQPKGHDDIGRKRPDGPH
jgi:hypothetical protein